MKYCSKCGNKLKEEDVFCSRCGAKTSVFGAYDKPGHEEKKTEIQTKMKKVLDPDAPGARYTAAVEKNAAQAGIASCLEVVHGYGDVAGCVHSHLFP